jgi:hypothetical protein
VFQAFARPAPSHPTGRVPEAASMRSMVARIAARSSTGSISVRRNALVWLWPIHSQPSLPPSSTFPGDGRTPRY